MEEHVLDGREALRIHRLAPCTEIECRDGVTWVTFTGDPTDYILRRGERLLVRQGRGAVFSSLGGSRFFLSRTAACQDGVSAPNLGMAAAS